MFSEPLWAVVAFVLGAIIGSFLNVVIYRLHTGKSINTPSHCLSCATPLRWYELFPLFSYLVLRARCRTCGAYVPVRYLAVELLTGLTFLLLWHVFSADPILFALNATLFSILIVIAVYDIRHTIIPNELTLAIYGVAALCVGVAAMRMAGWNIAATLYDILGGTAAGFFFWGLWKVSHGRWIGLGDAKLALPLGIIVGTTGVFSMVVLSFWIGAAISLLFLGLERLLKKGKTSLLFPHYHLTIKSEVPFAPFLILGFLLAHLFNVDIFDITYRILTL